MQYILTEEEYNSLIRMNKAVIANKDKVIVELCKKLRDTTGERCAIGAKIGCGACDDCPLEILCEYCNKDYSE